MEIGFVGLGNMGFPMARRLIQHDHHVIAVDTRSAVLESLAALEADAASSPKEVAGENGIIAKQEPYWRISS